MIFADKLMQSGFRLATRGGISIAMGDMLIPSAKESILAEASREVKEIDKQYSSGLVTSRNATTTWWTSGARPATRSARR